MLQDISLSEIKGLVGKEVGVSDWITVTQETIDKFAEATGDYQYIHVDPVRAAAETPFGGTIAHGFLSLSLLSAMNYNCLPKIREQTMGINYGFEKVRFVAPDGTSIRVTAEDFPHLALWSRPPGPFLCIESWTGFGDLDDFEGDITTKPSMRCLAPGGEARHAVQLSVHEARA